MDSVAILERLKRKSSIDNIFEVFVVDNACYFGKDKSNNIVFMILSKCERVSPINQETRSLQFAFNRKCTFRIGDTIDTKIVHLLICKEHAEDKIMAFIRLTKAFAQNDYDNDQYYLAKLFSSISALFDKKRKVSENELQGLFAELYTILYFFRSGCDLSTYWQSRKMMKFDFMLDDKKRIEIKSTVKSSRTHHFRHEQLQSELYDIKIVSLMLRKSDTGISLEDVVNSIRDIYANNYALLMHIEALIAHVDDDMLRAVRYDEIHLQDNLRFYDAKDIPHFNEKTPDGVFNAEYDCCLDIAPFIDKAAFIAWIQS